MPKFKTYKRKGNTWDLLTKWDRRLMQPPQLRQGLSREQLRAAKDEDRKTEENLLEGASFLDLA